MSGQTLGKEVHENAEGSPGTGVYRRSLRGWPRKHPWWTTSIALVLLSAALAKWAATRPSYDAYGWLVWGYQTLHLHLDLGGSPSWKPLPFLLTVPYALAGYYELHLWMITAVAVALAGALFGGRIAYRVVAGEAPGRRLAACAAAGFAGAAVLALRDYAHFILSAQSDPAIVTLTLAAIDMHLCGRPRAAFALGALAGLGRPEAWCLLVPYSLYLWLRETSLRFIVATGWGAILFLWFGIPTITNGRPFISAQLAFNSPRALLHDQIGGTLQRFAELYDLPIWLAAAGTVVWASLRRRWLIATLAGAAALWVLTEIAFALHGWPGLPRYMFEPAAICGVIAGIGFGWLLIKPPPRNGRVLRLAGPALALVLVAALIPDAKTRYDAEQSDLRHEHERTARINALAKSLTALGGSARIRSCGVPVIDVEWLSAMAYAMHMDVGFVGYKTEGRRPIVVFTMLPKGWRILPQRIPRADRARCAGLHADWVANPQRSGRRTDPPALTRPRVTD
ncbi:MAG: hypothetical protein ACLP0J_00645 [Solirubrobacteraceae bacterium]